MPRGYFDQSLGALSVDMVVMKDLMLQRLPATIQHLETLQNASGGLPTREADSSAQLDAQCSATAAAEKHEMGPRGSPIQQLISTDFRKRVRAAASQHLLNALVSNAVRHVFAEELCDAGLGCLDAAGVRNSSTNCHRTVVEDEQVCRTLYDVHLRTPPNVTLRV